MTFDPEVRRLIACLKANYSADDVCAGDEQFLNSREILQFIRYRSDSSKIGEGIGRSFPKHDTEITATA